MSSYIAASLSLGQISVTVSGKLVPPGQQCLPGPIGDEYHKGPAGGRVDSELFEVEQGWEGPGISLPGLSSQIRFPSGY